jgi:hypothetical protein
MSDYTELVRQLGLLGIPICEPRSLAATLIAEIQAGREAREVCGRAADHLGMFRRENPHHNMNPDLVTAHELLRRVEDRR